MIEIFSSGAIEFLSVFGGGGFVLFLINADSKALAKLAWAKVDEKLSDRF